MPSNTLQKKIVYVKNIESAWKISGKDGQLAVEHTAFMDPSAAFPIGLSMPRLRMVRSER
ncbi:MAG: hypothetical protein U0V54_10115 [Saprospiraceae bacterium]